MKFLNLILILNKNLIKKKNKYLFVKFSKNNLLFLQLLLQLTLVTKVIIHKTFIKFKLIHNKLKFIFLKKKNQSIYLTRKKLKQITKKNIYIFHTNKGLKTSLNFNSGGVLLTKIIFKN